jgi:hypothetical protein
MAEQAPLPQPGPEANAAAADRAANPAQPDILEAYKQALAKGEITVDQYADQVRTAIEGQMRDMQQSVQDQGRVPAGAEAGPPVAPPVREAQLPPLDEDEQMLLGATDRPDEPVTAGLDRWGRVEPSQEVHDLIPVLAEAAKDPNAPEGLRRLLELLGYHLGQPVLQ